MATSDSGLGKALLGGVVIVALFLIVPPILAGVKAKRSRSSVEGFSSLFSRLNGWFGDPTESAQLAYLLSSGNTIGQASATVEESPRDAISAMTGVDLSAPVNVYESDIAEQIPYVS